MSGTQTPRDNAVIESFFGRFKDVLRLHFRCCKYDNLNKVIANAVHYFNYLIAIRKLKIKTPVQYRIELAT